MKQTFKPNLIPNNPKDGSMTPERIAEIVEKNGGAEKYYASIKRDGVRLEFGLKEYICSRTLKKIANIQLQERFKEFNELCLKLGIIVDAEFYAHGLKLNEILRFSSTIDLLDDKYKESLKKEFKKSPDRFIEEYGGRTVEFLTTFHKNLKAYIFDVYIVDEEFKNAGFEDRLKEMYSRLSKYSDEVLGQEETIKILKYIELPEFESIESSSEIPELFNLALSNGYEGIVLSKKDRVYKHGRHTLKNAGFLKMKDDNKEYDGVVLDVIEGTEVIEGAEKKTNELGRSVTSKKKDDRRPSGKASGFEVAFEDKGTFKVSLKGFTDDMKRELLENKEAYIGRHFKYSAMKPNKKFPISAYFKTWRDEK
ncbi:DNA ligase [Tenacibaculum phage Larrie]|nr:DNA ligase [Tenacibaculum phage Larrie]